MTQRKEATEQDAKEWSFFMNHIATEQAKEKRDSKQTDRQHEQTTDGNKLRKTEYNETQAERELASLSAALQEETVEKKKKYYYELDIRYNIDKFFYCSSNLFSHALILNI